MNYTIIKKLPDVEEIIQAIPLSDSGQQKVKRDRQEIKNILEGQDNRLIMIVGPCSAWPKPAVLEYAQRLLALNEKIKHVIKLVMRVYIQKPRTVKGWAGPVNQPDLYSLPDIAAGISYTRDMMVKIIEMGLPIADEALFTHNAKGFIELLSWVAIGARSSEDQEHRIFASAMDCAVGLKNPTHGSLWVGVNSVIAVQHAHVAVFDGYEVRTKGNAHAHLVLRGGAEGPNYSAEHLTEVARNMARQKVKNPAVIIDASHDNCLINGQKDHRLQGEIVLDVVEELKKQPALKQLVKGFMLESFLKEGQQKVDMQHVSAIDLGGLSITDPCLSWEQTETVLINLAKKVSSNGLFAAP